MQHEVIMPALGMAQDTGLIVAWQKAPGDAVAAGDVLFEVETDKSTVEVEASHDGFVAALLAEAGEEAPVGSVIALISAEKPENPVRKSLTQKALPGPETAEEPAAEPAPAAVAKTELPSVPVRKPAPAPVLQTGLILASPKARRLAAEQGLDLGRLVANGFPQPYHVDDLEVLKALPAAATTGAPAVQQAQITARISRKAHDEFCALLDGMVPASSVWAAFSAASLRAVTGAETLIVRVDQPALGVSSYFADPDTGPISTAVPSDADTPPNLMLIDLMGTRITGGRFPAGDAPILTVTAAGDDLLLTLDFAADQLATDVAIALLDGFAGRLEVPLRQLL